ncbi:hypothetical protein CEP51_011344 [Fusarium floridanum]|uniref:Uncharacterized protein n=1 Tax=Fusarium floridanum TaxID=1325733 RepID=A0A428RBM2_9HYPO|nr:hypothetical protein CEP51_011344 [Fusarium floridanum]
MTTLSTEAIVAIIALPIGLALSALAIFIAYLQLSASRRNRAQNDVEFLPLTNYSEALLMRPTQSGIAFESQHHVQYQMIRWERNIGDLSRFSTTNRMPAYQGAGNSTQPALHGILPPPSPPSPT